MLFSFVHRSQRESHNNHTTQKIFCACQAFPIRATVFGALTPYTTARKLVPLWSNVLGKCDSCYYVSFPLTHSLIYSFASLAAYSHNARIVYSALPVCVCVFCFVLFKIEQLVLFLVNFLLPRASLSLSIYLRTHSLLGFIFFSFFAWFCRLLIFSQNPKQFYFGCRNRQAADDRRAKWYHRIRDDTCAIYISKKFLF